MDRSMCEIVTQWDEKESVMNELSTVQCFERAWKERIFYTFSMIFMSIPKNPHKSLGSWKFRFFRMCNGFLHSYIAINPHQNDRSYMPHSATFLLSLTRNRANIIFAFLYTEYCTYIHKHQLVTHELELSRDPKDISSSFSFPIWN